MSQEELENEVINLYEQVAVMGITPNEARMEFMKLINQYISEIIGEDEDLANHNCFLLEKGYECPQEAVNDKLAEQRKKAGI